MKKIALALLLMIGLQGCSWLGMDDWFSSPPEPEPQMNPVDEVKKAQIEAFPYEQMAPEAPPAPKSEYKGNPPGNNTDEYTWRKGHWEYRDGSGFAWLPGYWLRKPAFTASWKQDMWLQRAYGWSYVPGHWE